MATYYAFFTEQCQTDAAKHGITDEIEKFADKLEQGQSTRGLEHFPPPYLKKCLGKQGRLVIEEYRAGDDIVLCLARYLIRGSAEYRAFYSDTNSYYEKNKVPRVRIETFLDERKKQPTTPKKPLSASELNYLQYPLAVHHTTDDGSLLESYDWFERISQAWAKDYLSRYYDLVVEIEHSNPPDGQTLVFHKKNADVKILYRRFPELRRTFMVAPIDSRNSHDEAELREKYKRILDPAQVDQEEIVRSSRRAYPSIITYDEKIWIQVQNSVEANLALSPEEENIVESVLMSGNDSPKYPLFINGRPGSGKSTILQYLFSEHLDLHMKLNGLNTFAKPPLYLTYSTPLLNQARSSVENILRCGAKTLQHDTKPEVDADRDNLITQSFRNFREFLLDQLPADVREVFVTANYIDFDQFRKKWDTNRHKHPVLEVRSIGSELA